MEWRNRKYLRRAGDIRRPGHHRRKAGALLHKRRNPGEKTLRHPGPGPSSSKGGGGGDDNATRGDHGGHGGFVMAEETPAVSPLVEAQSHTGRHLQGPPAEKGGGGGGRSAGAEHHSQQPREKLLYEDASDRRVVCGAVPV